MKRKKLEINAPVIIILILIIAFIATELNTTITGKAVIDTSNIEETSYVYGNGLVAQYKNGNLEYYHLDHLGSPSIITDSSGAKISEQKYDVFGMSLNPEVSRLEFTGKELDDDTNLHYFNARYYDSSVGRFTSADVIKGKISNPQSLNLYAYTINNPLKYVDPSGNEEENFGPIKTFTYTKNALYLVANYDTEIEERSIEKIKMAGYTVTTVMVSNAQEFIDAIVNFPGAIDLLYASAHGDPYGMTLSKDQQGNLKDININDLRNVDLSNKFSSDACTILGSCHLANPNYENNFATFFSRATGNIPTEAYLNAGNFLMQVVDGKPTIQYRTKMETVPIGYNKETGDPVYAEPSLEKNTHVTTINPRQ